MHLTNYAINKLSPEFEFNTDANKADTGHKRSMSSVFQAMRDKGEDVDEMWEEIKRMLIKTICSAQPILAHHYKSCQPDDYHNHMCFEILGFDFLINNKLKPVLLEINHTPSFSVDTPFDREIKTNVIHDTLKLMNVSQKMKKKIIAQKKKEMEKRVLTGKRVRLTAEEKELIHKKCQMERDEYIEKNMGEFE